MNPKTKSAKATQINEIQHISYTYEVTDAYDHVKTFDTKEEAWLFAQQVDLEKTIIEYIKPKGVTLVLCKNPNVFYKVYPCFIGWNGVPFCDVLADKERGHFMNLDNSIERLSSLNGDLCEIIQKAYKLFSTYGTKTFDYRDGACHYSWHHTTGNEFCFDVDEYWLKDVFWYNWDGKQFTTNDPNCKLSNNDFHGYKD